MNKLIYHIKSALKPRMRNIISILSLALGLALSLVVFANIVYDRSYDNFHQDKDRMYIVKAYYIDEGVEDVGSMIPDIVLPTLIAEVSEVNQGTLFRHQEGNFKIENNSVSFGVIAIDTCFFDIFNFQVITGNPKEDFKDPSTIYISKSKVYDLFGDEDPIGEVLIGSDGRQRVVRGVYLDFPKNSMVNIYYGDPKGLESIVQFKRDSEWYGGDRSIGVLTLREGVGELEAEEKIQALIDTKYDRVEAEAKNMLIEYRLIPIADEYANSPEVVQKVLIMGCIALLLILVSALNYALISISSLSLRLKEIAVRKCSGASELRILGLVTIETAIHATIALVFAVVFIFAFQSYIESYFVPVEAIFRAENIWYLLIVVPLIVLFSAVIPGKIFAKIPITSLFTKSVNRRQMWKKMMLLLQFFFSIALLSISLMLFKQYNYFLNRDIGYNYSNLVHTNIKPQDIVDVDKYYNEIKGLSFVESVSFTHQKLMSGLSGIGIMEGDVMLFSSRCIFASSTFFDNIGAEFIDGESFSQSSQITDVIVNEKFTELMNWNEDELMVGKIIASSDFGDLRIVGIVKNFIVSGDVTNSLIDPLVVLNIYPLPKIFPNILTTYGVVMNIRLNKVTPSNLDSIEAVISQLNPNAENISIRSYISEREHLLSDFKKYVVGMNVGGLLILIISAMGLYGYISNELQFKHREIALRKVYGSSVPNIILTVYKPIFNILCVAALLAIPLSYYVGNMVLSMNFTDIAPMPWWWFFVTSLFVVLFSLTIVVLRSIKIASQNPIKAIHE